MPSPLGHTVVSSSIALFSKKRFSFKKDWRFLIVCIIIGLLPDIDLLFVIVQKNPGLHRSVTHCILFVLISAFLLSCLFNKLGFYKEKKYFFVFSMLLGAHILCDFFTIDEILHGGIMFFYPFSKTYIPSPVYLFMGFDWRKASILCSPYMMKVMLREFIITVPLLVTALIIQKKSYETKN